MIEDILKWNETDTEDFFSDSIQKIMHDTAVRFSERTAVTDKKQSITYGQLDALSNAVCNFLLEKYNDTDNHICVSCCNCIEKICYIVGILKAGMTYVPLDINLPAQRNRTIAENVKPAVVLADRESYEKAKSFSDNVCVFTISELENMNTDYTEIVRENRTAYIIYTSGSTGVPKGVCIPEKSLLNFCGSIINLTEITENDRTLTVQNPAFDASIMDMIPFIMVGASLYCIPDEIKKDIKLVNKYMIENRITVQTMSTALYHLFIEEENDVLQKVFVIGEKMLKYKKKPYRIYNMYGPTEATVLVTYGEVTEQSDNIPIGMPIANTKIIIVKEDGTMADVDEYGEICLMGKNLSSGYLNNRSETEKRFVPSVIDPEKIMYRTGDIGMWTSGGELLCFGRIDFQIKHRGYRIELDEIRYNILELDYIDNCAVIYNDRAENGYIVCFYCPADGNDIPVDRFIKDLDGNLPEYMIPSRWIKTENIPLNNSGKIDRAKLFEMLDAVKNTSSEKSAGNDVTDVLRRIWAETLDIEESFDGNSDFRTLGGHSILSMIIIKDVKEALNVDISFKEFVGCRNFNEFAEMTLAKSKNSLSKKSTGNDVTDVLRKIWAETLDIEESFDGNSDFRTLGGHSILSMIIIKEVKETLNVDISFKEFVGCRNFNEFAEMTLAKTENSTDNNALPDTSADRYEPFSLNPLQTAYVVGRNSDMPLGHIPTHMYYEVVCDDFELQRLISVFNKIFKAHDMLRIRVDNTGKQKVLPYYEINAEQAGFTDISGLDDEKKKIKFSEIRHGLETFRPDMKNGSLIKTAVVKTDEKSAVICAYLDSVIIDGWSAEELINELNTLYSNPDYDIKPTSQNFRDYNNIIDKEKSSPEHDRDKEYWTKLLPDLQNTPVMLLKNNPQSVTSPHTRRIERSIPSEKWKNFETICAENKISSVAVLYAVIGNVISHFSLTDSFTINLPIQKRFMKDMSFNELIGNCTSFLLFSYKEYENDSWLELFHRSSEQITERLSHDSFSGLEINELIRNATGKNENTSRIMFTSIPDLSRNNSQLWRKTYAEARTSQVWIDIISVTYGSNVNFIWSYVTELFSDETVQAMADMFVGIIDGLCSNPDNINCTVSSFYENKPEYLHVSDDSPLIHDFTALYSEKEFALKDRTGMTPPVGAIGEIHTADGSPTGFDGVYESGKIRLLGKTENRMTISETVIYSDCIEYYVRKHNDVNDTALVYDEKNEVLYMFYTAEKDIPTAEFDDILKKAVLPKNIVYRKTDRIYRRSDGRTDKRRMLKSSEKRFASLFS